MTREVLSARHNVEASDIDILLARHQRPPFQIQTLGMRLNPKTSLFPAGEATRPSIYTNYTTYIIDDEGIEQIDSLVASPAGNKLVLGFNRIPKV